MNGTSVSNGTRLSPISISQRSFGKFPESFGKWKTPHVPFTTQPEFPESLGKWKTPHVLFSLVDPDRPMKGRGLNTTRAHVNFC